MKTRIIEQKDAPPRPPQINSFEMDRLVISLEPGKVLEVVPDEGETVGSLKMKLANTRKRLAKSGFGFEVDYYDGPSDDAVYVMLKHPEPEDSHKQN